MSLYKRALTRTAAILLIVIIVVVAALGVGLYSYLTPPSATISTAGAQIPLVVDLKGSPDTLDPLMAFSGEGEEINGNVFLAPLYYNNSATEFFPILARSWTVSPDGCTFTFNWRNDVYYSNGDPFNAYVVWFGIYRAVFTQVGLAYLAGLVFNSTGVTLTDVNSLNNSMNAPSSSLLSVMQNPHSAVTVLNSTATRFNLTHPCFASNFLGIMAAGYMFLFPDPYFIEQHGGVIADQAPSYFTIHGSDVGDGPYVVQTYIPDEYAVLVANPHYWAQNLPTSDPSYNYFTRPARIQKVIFNFKTDELTRALDIESDRAQIGIIQFPDIKNVLAGDSNLYVPNWGPSGTVEFIGLDSLKPPLNNVLVRRAIIYAINLTLIQQSVFNGYSMSVVGPALHGFFGYNDSIKPPAYNPDEARRLLGEAGYPNGTGLRPLTFLLVSGSFLVNAAQIIASELAQVGITVNIQIATEASQIAIVESCCGNSTRYPDLLTAGTTFYPDMFGTASIIDMQLMGWFFFDNTTIDNLILEYAYTPNQMIRAQLVTEVTLLVQQQAPVIWLSQDVDVPQTGNGVGPAVFNKCLASDMVGNPYYWVFQGIPYTSAHWVCTPGS
jgi:peptide/nickel transport system substrate-binding protein